MLARRPLFSFGAGVGISLVLHALLIVPALVALFTAEQAPPVLVASLMASPPAEESEPRPDDEVDPGVESSPAITMTIVGYDEYQKHIARLQNEVDQAAFAPDAGDAGAPPPQPVGAPPPETVVADQAALEQAAQAQVASLLAMLDELATIRSDATAPRVEPKVEQPADGPKPTETPATAAGPEAPKPDAPKPSEPTPVEPAPSPKPVEPKPTTPGAPPAPSAPPADDGDSPRDGDRSPRESPAASIETSITDIRMGKPLARQGLELYPRAPRLTTLTRVTSSPANPLVEIRFGRDGVPSDARILVSCGDARVDEALRTSLYRWRARGVELENLEGDETANVRITIKLR